jgi:hypothetical protein
MIQLIDVSAKALFKSCALASGLLYIRLAHFNVCFHSTISTQKAFSNFFFQEKYLSGYSPAHHHDKLRAQILSHFFKNLGLIIDSKSNNKYLSHNILYSE